MGNCTLPNKQIGKVDKLSGSYTLPRSQASKVANDLAAWGVKGMWNFSHVDLAMPEDVIVENVHLTDSLMTLLYKINEVETEEGQTPNS